ncbi:MAG: ornithine cyclodeaminase family protein, partial [Spirochaetia bacterium]|nr:ornithine cyclodeaminase family protein [Spirochaetia bacterium]
MKHKILLLDARDIRKIFTMKEAVKTTEKAFKDFASGRARMPVKVYLDLPEYNGDFRAMPAFMPSPPLAGVKWVNSHPDNAKRKLPSVMAMMIVND